MVRQKIAFHPSLPESLLFPAFNPAIAVHVAAAGYRSASSGALANVGTSGYAWSSSPNSSTSVNAGNLGFDASVVNPLNNNNRANGFPVRCVQHLHGAAPDRRCCCGFRIL